MKHTAKHKYIGLITVRTSSSRLPQKALQSIGSRSLIEHVIDRAKLSLEKGLSNIVLCTSTEPADDVLEQIAKENNIDCFRGSNLDKIDRWRGAAEKFGADYAITIDGDDPFCDPELVELAINQIEESSPDVITADNSAYVCGGFTHGISTKTLQAICEMKASEDTEMTKPYLIESGKFSVAMLYVPEIFKGHKARLTLDYPEDLEFFRAVFQEMKMEKNIAPLRDILEFLNSHPEIMDINLFRQGDFVANQKKAEKLELK
ncbi:MAG: hypothetical protein V4438_03015 [Patescibacteria group bacterium]